jgi:hypothetical protein
LNPTYESMLSMEILLITSFQAYCKMNEADEWQTERKGEIFPHEQYKE